jgi:hypothetical protein
MSSLSERIEGQSDLLVWSLPVEQQQFLFAVMDGATQEDAYRLTHPNAAPSTAKAAGCRYANSCKVIAARDELLRLAGEEALRILRAAAPKAALVLAKGLEGDDPERTALAILDRIGVGPRMGLDVSQTRINGLDEFLEATRAVADQG